ncbi:MAG: hypothetical protein ACJA0I_001392 [Gammaproteobacteria bacterium]|jgi:hypothetical protein
MLPMGTIVTCCMIAGLIFAVPPVNKGCPRPICTIVGTVVLTAGLWNVIWYASQNFGEFWGLAALCSGVLMIITSVFILNANWLPAFVRQAKAVILLMLLGFALLYAITIIRL